MCADQQTAQGETPPRPGAEWTKTAATWVSQMLFTEPLKVIGAVQANGRTETAWLLVLVMASQLLAYL